MLCLFRVGCAVDAVLAGIGITRVVAHERVLGEGRAGRELRLQVDAGADLIAWLGLAAAIAARLMVGLAL